MLLRFLQCKSYTTPESKLGETLLPPPIFPIPPNGHCLVLVPEWKKQRLGFRWTNLPQFDRIIMFLLPLLPVIAQDGGMVTANPFKIRLIFIF